MELVAVALLRVGMIRLLTILMKLMRNLCVHAQFVDDENFAHVGNCAWLACEVDRHLHSPFFTHL